MRYFRRNHFPMVPDQQPKWHVLATARAGHLTALCGYTYFFVLEDAMIRSDVKTAKLRCSTCDARSVKA